MKFFRKLSFPLRSRTSRNEIKNSHQVLVVAEENAPSLAFELPKENTLSLLLEAFEGNTSSLRLEAPKENTSSLLLEASEENTPCSLSEIPRANTLSGLPTELLLLITDFLPLEDSICVSLCNRRLFSRLHPQDPSILPSGKDKISLLTRLERDSPGFFPCHSCHLLHKYDPSRDFAPRSMNDRNPHPLPCFSKWNGYDTLTTFWYPVRFIHVQLAMKIFYQGPPFGIGAEDIQYTQVVHYPEKSTVVEKVFLSSIDASVCSEPPSLIVRIQEVLAVSRDESDRLYWKRSWPPLSFQDFPFTMFLSMHIEDMQLGDLINPVVKAYQLGEKPSMLTYICRRCDTEIRIEICEYQDKSALIITRRLNVGAGLSPDDPHWKRHVDCSEMRRIGELRRISYNDVRDSVRARFESESLDKLRSRNISYLKDEKYKSLMHKAYYPEGVWHTPYKT